jgi:hypothetical protein
MSSESNGNPNPFDPATLRLSQDFSAQLGLNKALITVPVRKPDKAWWVRVRPGEEHRLLTATIELKEDREIYLVAPELRHELATEATFSAREFRTAVNRQGVLFLWPLRLPGPDGKFDEWSRSALEAADRAQQGWVRVTSNMSLGAYEVWEAAAPLPDPQWSEQPLGELLKVAFKDRYIDRADHPVLRKLRGEV